MHGATMKIIHVITLIHSSLCVLNFRLPSRGPNVAEFAHTTYPKVDQT